MDGWTDRQTDDKGTDESDFIGHCWTNVEHPINAFDPLTNLK